MVTKVMIRSFLVNLSLTILKILGAFFTNSKTLLGDAIHCLSDMMTDIIGLIGTKLSTKKPDEEHPFGHGKIEYLTSIIMSVFIIILGLTIIKNALIPSSQATNPLAIIIVLITIIIKYILSGYLLEKGKTLNNNILIANGIESRYDSYSSMLALIFIVISILGSKNNILIYADVLGSIIMSIFTLKIGVHLLLTNISSVLGEVETDNTKINNVKELVQKQKEILKIRRVTMLKYGSYYSVTIEIIMDGNVTLNELYKIEKEIKSTLKKSELNIRYVTVNAKPKNKHVREV